jgi:hypothetical protein
MTQFNRPINSREFKLMLKPDVFPNRDEGLKNFLAIIDSTIVKQSASLKVKIKQENRRTWYLDTNQHTLYNDNNFLLRIRKEPNEYDITLKCRHPDRYLSASHNLKSPVKKLKETKFEEDISTDRDNTFYSRFSLSAKFEEKQEPVLHTFQDLRAIFPGLNIPGIANSEGLNIVNQFEASEFSYKIGELVFADGNKVSTGINFWYLSDEESIPIIIEFTFDYKANDPSTSNETLLEEFPPSLIENTNKFYLSLRQESVADLDTSSTKTEFAYKYKKH